MDFVHIVSEDRIRRAIEDGEFDHLPGKGKPLVLDDMSGIPADLRMAYKMLKNAGMLEEESDYRKELMRIEDLIACCDDDTKETRLQKQLNEKLLSFNKVIKKRDASNSKAFKQYQHKIDRLFE